MLNVAKTNSENRAVIEVVFKDYFSKNIFDINGVKLDSNYVKRTNSLDFDTLLEVFRYFGHLITKLRVYYNYLNAMQRKTLNEHINEFSSQSLIQFELDHCYDSSLVGLTGPFTKVQTVFLRMGATLSNATNFRTIFPAIQYMNLAKMSSVQPATMEHHFPLMEYLIVERCLGTSGKKEMDILRRRLALNPQLRRITFSSNSNWQTLKIVSETLPHVEQIDAFGFKDDEYNGDDIHLTNVKVFKFNTIHCQPSHIPRIPLVFGNIEEILCNKPIERWFDIIIQNKNLRKITIGELNDKHLQRIATELTILDEFTMEFEKINQSIINIVQFIETAKNLKRATFLKTDIDARNEILKRVKLEWKIISKDSRIVFIRN